MGWTERWQSFGVRIRKWHLRRKSARGSDHGEIWGKCSQQRKQQGRDQVTGWSLACCLSGKSSRLAERSIGGKERRWRSTGHGSDPAQARLTTWFRKLSAKWKGRVLYLKSSLKSDFISSKIYTFFCSFMVSLNPSWWFCLIFISHFLGYGDPRGWLQTLRGAWGACPATQYGQAVEFLFLPTAGLPGCPILAGGGEVRLRSPWTHPVVDW